MRFRGGRQLVAALAVVPLVMMLASCTKHFGSLNRLGDPVIMTGDQLPKLLGAAPQHIVGFAWDGSGWTQVPVQVDERDWVSPGQILNEPPANWPMVNGQPYKILVYTPTNWTSTGYTSWPTYTPPDSDPTFDSNDQLSFMQEDTGLQAADGTAPTGFDPTQGQAVKVTDPLDANGFGWLYLYVSPTLTGGDGGNTGVNYNFSLDSGDYRSTYKMGTGAQAPNNVAGPNPEHSTVTTAFYTQGWNDRWLNNSLGVLDGGAPGTQMLDRSRIQNPTSSCDGTEDTFDDQVPSTPYEGAFVANISGPVRAIRSVLGAGNSPYMVETDFFYNKNEQSTFDLRGPSITSLSMFDDFLPSQTGLVYSDDQTTGANVDGVPDTLTDTHMPAWQMVSGPPGSLITSWVVNTNITGLTETPFYLDQNPANPPPCTGDAAAWGQSGVTLTAPPAGSAPVCTDPVACPTPTLSATRYRYFEEVGFTAAEATSFSQRADNPLQETVS
jgi:hypothetical protein